MNPAEIYNRAYDRALASLECEQLDLKDPLVKKIAREIANEAVNKAVQERLSREV